MTLPRALLPALIAATLALATPLEAQLDPNQIPRRPPLQVNGDSNSAVDYFWYGMSQLAREPERAAAAFYWASRIDPYWADPLYARYVALLVAQPWRLLNAYMTKSLDDLREPRLRAIDSLFYAALLRNPWVNRRMERILIATWLQVELDGGSIPRYFRQENPGLGAWLSYTEGKFEASAAEFATALTKDPDDHLLRFWRALPFLAMDQNDSAIAAVRDGLSAHRASDAENLSFRYVGHPFMEYSLGLLFEHVNQPDSARVAYERSLLDDLTFYPAHRKLATLRLAAGDTAGALAEFEQAVTLAPNDPVILYEFGMISLAAGQAVSGFGLLQRASQAEPFFVPAHFALARIYDQSGFAEEAIQEYRSFLRLAPRTMEAQMAAVRQRLAALGVPPVAP